MHGLRKLQVVPAPPQPAPKPVKPVPAKPLVPAKRLKVAILDEMEPNARQAELGAQFQVVVKFQPVQQMRYPFLVKPYLDQGYEVVMVTEFLDDMLVTNLQEIGDGLYDDYLYQFIDELKDDGNRAVWIRPMHEFNGDWYPWGTYHGGTNTIDNFIRAWQHIHDVFTVKKANVKFQLAYNCDNAQDDVTTPFTAWWPGDEYVDMVVCSGYNRAGSDENHMEWLTFQDVYANAYNQMAALPGLKPLGVGEMSCNDFGDYDKAQWIRDAFADFDTTFTRVTQVTWFLQNKDDGRWDLNTPDEIQAFGDCLREYTDQNQIQRLPPVPPQVDVNLDGVINGDDAPEPPVPIDLNGDGVIDELDATQAPAVGGIVGADVNGDGAVAGPAELPGDFNYDGAVNANDQLIAGLQGDFNGDGVIAGPEELPGDDDWDGVVDGAVAPPAPAAPPATAVAAPGKPAAGAPLVGAPVAPVKPLAPAAPLTPAAPVAPGKAPAVVPAAPVVPAATVAPPVPPPAGNDLNGDNQINGPDELPGDYNWDGVVDANDVAPPPPPAGNDLNGDNQINGPDELPGDYNWDGVVDANAVAPPPPPAGNDLNGDNQINGPDELPGDYNWDGVVDANDAAPPVPPPAGNDYNGDNQINGPDELPGDYNWDGVVDGNDVAPPPV